MRTSRTSRYIKNTRYFTRSNFKSQLQFTIRHIWTSWKRTQRSSFRLFCRLWQHLRTTCKICLWKFNISINSYHQFIYIWKFICNTMEKSEDQPNSKIRWPTEFWWLSSSLSFTIVLKGIWTTNYQIIICILREILYYKR